ncbi:helix-turn-helix domain-containing protein [Phenylobacterium sp. VNQ135]|uniref:helix-turn-helix domain-containing protein n=1 Tax=Phenylobacterium sp. VNQ135 TaxID=3400922 RepID=UPI003C0790F3
MTAREPRPLPRPDAQSYEAERRRLLNRASIAYLLDVVTLARDGRHPLDALLLSTITQANVAQVSARADLQVELASAHTPPPDEMRRPVSINALASSLRLPFETVRRRVHALKAAGLCRIEPAGVVVPTEILLSEPYLRQAYAAYERLRVFHATLSDLGALEGLPAPTIEHDGGFLPLRAVARLATDYVLRALDLAQAEFHDLFSALLLLEVVRSNTEHLGLRPESPEMLDPRGFLYDAHRRPVRVSQLAERVGLPRETARRHVRLLLDAGWLQRAGSGVIAPAKALARPGSIRFAVENTMHLRRMFAALSQLGVLAIWDDLRARPAT